MGTAINVLMLAGLGLVGICILLGAGALIIYAWVTRFPETLGEPTRHHHRRRHRKP